jgi:hypothetical protein
MERWHRMVADHDSQALDDLLADDVVFHSPVVHTPQVGRKLTSMYLRAAMQLLGNAGFRYLNEWSAERSAVLEFEATIDGIQVNGVDMIDWNADGRITRFKVMVRPLKAINLMHQAMAQRLR